MSEVDQAVWVITSFLNALIIIYMTARWVGEERKARWFKKRQKITFFTRRGPLGEAWHFGVPRTWQGFAVAIAMYGAIGLLSYVMYRVVSRG